MQRRRFTQQVHATLRVVDRGVGQAHLWQSERSTSQARAEVRFAMSKPHRTHHRSRFQTTRDDEEQRVDMSSTTRISIAFTASTFTVC
jgi:hypothetical protein